MIWYYQWTGILQYFLFVESGLDCFFESSSISLHASYLILILFDQLGYDIGGKAKGKAELL